MEGVKCVLLDIEGTICPISFVKDTLFPYALKALPDVVTSKWDDPDFVHYRDAFPEEHRGTPAALQAHVEDLTRRDVKVAYLKNLQGYLWEVGYETGAYATPLFPDVETQLTHWKLSGLQLAIYSSGSVLAQKLLFGHVQTSPSRFTSTASEGAKPTESSTHGNGVKTEDLRSLITDWFDTTNAGPKLEAKSYAHIANVVNRSPEEMLFFSDNVKEIEAAEAAGMRAVLVVRPGNAPVTEDDKKVFKTVETLSEISLSPARIDARFWKK